MTQSIASTLLPPPPTPHDALFAWLWCTRTEIHPLQVGLVRGIHPLNWLVRGVFTLQNFVLWPAQKSGNGFPLVRHGYHSCDLGSSAMLSAQSYILCLQLSKHCDLLVLKIIILWEAVCITLYSKNPTTTFKIRFWVFPYGLWRAAALNTEW